MIQKPIQTLTTTGHSVAHVTIASFFTVESILTGGLSLSLALIYQQHLDGQPEGQPYQEKPQCA